MKSRNTPATIALALSLGALVTANAWSSDDAGKNTGEQQEQARLEAEYANAMSAAEQQQRAAESSLQRARDQLERAAEQRALSEKQSVEALSAREAEMTKMHEELLNARRQLQETSREIARVNREVARARADGDSTRFVYRASERPVIGVILGDVEDGGVKSWAFHRTALLNAEALSRVTSSSLSMGTSLQQSGLQAMSETVCVLH